MKFSRKIVLKLLSFVIVVLLCTGCTKTTPPDTSPEYNPETDYRSAYDSYGIGCRVAETEQGYYYVSSMFRKYIDKESMTCMTLCNKPNCSHNLEDADLCGSFTGGLTAEEMYEYQGKLYGFVEEDISDEIGVRDVFLCEIAKDGTFYKKIWRLDWEVESTEHFHVGFFHRGKFYFYTMGQNVSEQNPHSTVHEYDLQKKKYKRLNIDLDTPIYGISAIGNYLYFRYVGEIDENGKVLVPPIVYQYEITTGTIKEFSGVLRCFAGGDKVFFEYWDETVCCRKLHYMNRDGTGYTETEVLLEGNGQADDKYIYSNPRWKGYEVEIYDVNTLELVDTIDCSQQVQESDVSTLLATDGKYILLCDSWRENIYYACKSAIGTDDFQWHKVEKVS